MGSGERTPELAQVSHRSVSGHSQGLEGPWGAWSEARWAGDSRHTVWTDALQGARQVGRGARALSSADGVDRCGE